MKKLTVRDMAYIAMMAVVISVCSWITVPAGDIPFTLQTFGVFCAVSLLGGRRGLISVCVYLALGLVGVPVFAGFTAGAGKLLGVTGGYLVGFVFLALGYWLVTAVCGEKIGARIAGMVLGLILCYAFGTVWFVVLYTKKVAAIGFAAALMKCVVPFILPDAVKLALAMLLTSRLRKPLGLCAA